MPHHLDREHKSRLTTPRQTVVPLCRQLIEMFVHDHRWNKMDRITWTTPTALSQLLVHPADKSLRIDFQKPFNATCRRCLGAHRGNPWANFALQHGSATYACVLLEMMRPYPATEVREAWLASLRESQNGHMEWSFTASKVEYAILSSLDARHPRDAREIIAELQRRFGQGHELVLRASLLGPGGDPERVDSPLRLTIQDLVGAGLAAKQQVLPRNAWTVTPAGTQTLAAAANPFVLGLEQN